MSDALTDITRDQRRSELFSKYIDTLLKYLKGEKILYELISSAKEVDSVRGGYSTGETNLSGKNNLEFVARLKEGDKKTWKIHLWRLDEDKMIEFQEISPFKGSKLMFISYERRNDIRISGPCLIDLLKSLIPENDTLSCGHAFMLEIPEDILNSLKELL